MLARVVRVVRVAPDGSPPRSLLFILGVLLAGTGCHASLQVPSPEEIAHGSASASVASDATTRSVEAAPDARAAAGWREVPDTGPRSTGDAARLTPADVEQLAA
jgi:hypothetical protein